MWSSWIYSRKSSGWHHVQDQYLMVYAKRAVTYCHNKHNSIQPLFTAQNSSRGRIWSEFQKQKCYVPWGDWDLVAETFVPAARGTKKDAKDEARSTAVEFVLNTESRLNLVAKINLLWDRSSRCTGYRCRWRNSQPGSRKKNTMIETGTRAGVKENKGSRTRQGWLLVAYAGVWTNKTHRIKCQAGLQLGDLQGGSLWWIYFIEQKRFTHNLNSFWSIFQNYQFAASDKVKHEE